MENSEESSDPFKPIADILFAYLHDIIYKPSKASLDIETLPESFRDVGRELQYLNNAIDETRCFAKELAIGNLDCVVPPSRNKVASSLKMLHSSLKHLTWQTQQVAKGDYNQNVSFMGDFSKAFNNMIEQLEQRRKITLYEKNKLEMYVHLILANSPNPILLFDKDGKVVYANDSYFRLCRVSNAAEFYEKQIPDLFESFFPQQSLEEIKQIYQSAVIEKKVFETGQEIVFKDNTSERYLKIQIAPMLDKQGNSDGVIFFIFDMTESTQARMAAERARELAEKSTRSKSNFLARMSYEIHTPMNAILGMAELAMRENVSPAAKEQIRTIRQGSLKLLSIINDILDFSKIEAGKMDILPKEYLLSSLVNDAANIIKMRVTESHLQFVVNIDCNIPNALFGDAVRIHQVLLNLLSNAFKYTEKGFVALSVNGEKINNDTINLKIEVTDSGRGIKQEEIEKVFKEFMRFDLEDNKDIEGRGLGLSITRGLVTAMNGKVDVHSEYGKGSTFTVILPQKIVKDQKIAAVKNPEKKSVLLYERREIYANSIVKTLENLGINYKFVSTTSDFFNCLLSKKYSFIFIASPLYEDVKKKYSDHKLDASFAVITEYGEAIADRNISILAMPVFPATVADFLNGILDSKVSNLGKESILKFVAPEAHIMIVDDIDTNLEVAEGLLQPYRVHTTLCKSGMEAIEKIKLACYDLVLMDYMMPDMDGVETVVHIRELGNDNPYYKSVPIVAFTADTIFGNREMILKNGFDDFLSKPIDMSKLNAILEKWIPKEKQKEESHQNAVTAKHDTYKKIEIGGLNEEKGLAMASGKIERYLKILSLFHKDALVKIKEVTTCLETNNIPLYVVHVHSLKSAAAIIGADTLSDAAKALEYAGKQNDLAFIQAHNATFIADLETLLHNINVFLSKEAAENQKKSIDKELLKKELARLKTALNDFDFTEINNATNSLQEFTQAVDIGDSVSSILQNKLTGEYDEAILLINTLLAKID